MEAAVAAAKAEGELAAAAALQSAKAEAEAAKNKLEEVNICKRVLRCENSTSHTDYR